jgi:hypothetical protein
MADADKAPVITYTTPKVICVNQHLLKPDSKEGKTGDAAKFAKEGVYHGKILLPKDMAGLKELQIKMLQAIEAENFEDAERKAADPRNDVLKAVRATLTDGDDWATKKPSKEKAREWAKGHWLMGWSSKYPPDVITEQGEPAQPAHEYSGMTAIFDGILKGWDGRDSKAERMGVSFYVNNVMIITSAKSPKLGRSGGGRSAREAFASLLGGQSDEDLDIDDDLPFG